MFAPRHTVKRHASAHARAVTRRPKLSEKGDLAEALKAQAIAEAATLSLRSGQMEPV